MGWLGPPEIGRQQDLGLDPVAVLAIAIILAIVLRTTAVGNWIFASGGDSRAARAMGVPVGAVKVGCFLLSSFWPRSPASFSSVFRVGDSDAGLRSRPDGDRRRRRRWRIPDGRPRQHHGRPAGGDRPRDVLHRSGTLSGYRRLGSSRSSGSCCCSPSSSTCAPLASEQGSE